MNGFLNKQITLEVSKMYPETTNQLTDLVRKTEASLTRMLRFGFAQGTVDPSATIGLEKPPQRVAIMAENPAPLQDQTIQALGRGGILRCYNCGDKRHRSEACNLGRVCYFCKKPGHMARECYAKPKEGNNMPGRTFNNSKPTGAPAKVHQPQVQAMGAAPAEPRTPQATWTGFQEGSL